MQNRHNRLTDRRQVSKCGPGFADLHGHDLQLTLTGRGAFPAPTWPLFAIPDVSWPTRK